MLSAPRILIIDDTADNVEVLTQALQRKNKGCCIQGLTDSTLALSSIDEFKPDLIILDLMMDEIDGFAILEALQPLRQDQVFLPILVITADMNESSRRRALSLGATDFLTRPHRLFDVELRVHNLLQVRELQLRCQEHNRHLEHLVQERTGHIVAANQRLKGINEELEQAQLENQLAKREMLERLALVGEHHDDDTGAHTRRVARTSALLCERLGKSCEESSVIRLAAPLHDVGKVGVSDTILKKPGRLSAQEFEVIKTHCDIGRQILDGGRSDLLRMACQIAFTHHERWDGQGYPHGLSGQDIPVEGRIVAVADVFDALTHARPYKQAWPVVQAVAEIRRQSGRQFDPDIVEVFLGLEHADLV